MRSRWRRDEVDEEEAAARPPPSLACGAAEDRLSAAACVDEDVEVEAAGLVSAAAVEGEAGAPCCALCCSNAAFNILCPPRVLLLKMKGGPILRSEKFRQPFVIISNFV